MLENICGSVSIITHFNMTCIAVNSVGMFLYKEKISIWFSENYWITFNLVMPL